MAKLKTKVVTYVSNLARLPLTNSQIEKMKEELSVVLNYFDQLNEADVERLDPTSQTTGLVNNTREDSVVVERQLSQKEALSNSDSTHNGYFVVPALLSKNK